MSEARRRVCMHSVVRWRLARMRASFGRMVGVETRRVRGWCTRARTRARLRLFVLKCVHNILAAAAAVLLCECRTAFVGTCSVVWSPLPRVVSFARSAFAGWLDLACVDGA